MTVFMNEENPYLNQLALSYNEGNEFALTDLADALEGFIKSRARIASRKADDMAVVIPAADFESAYTQALWEAAKDYDGSSEFMQRFRTRMQPREADVWRTYQTNVNGKATYAKGKNDYLDRPTNCSDNTFGDVIFEELSINNTGDDLVGEHAILEAIEEFKAQNERFYIIIKALSFEATNEQIAKALGEAAYNGKVRAVVCRARESFKKFLNDRDFSI